MRSHLTRIALIATTGAFGWVSAAALSAAPAAACQVTPGESTCAPDSLTLTSATELASTTSTINASQSGDTINATYTETVYRDANNTYGSNDLTWLLQVTNLSSSNDVIDRVTVSNFSGFATDIGTDTSAPPSGFVSGTQSPNNVGRNSNGAILNWDFSTNEIHPGQTSVVLEVETNSTTYKPGTVSVQDGIAGSGPGYGPAAIPEIAFVPAFGLFGGALVGGMVWRRRRRDRRTVSS